MTLPGSCRLSLGWRCSGVAEGDALLPGGTRTLRRLGMECHDVPMTAHLPVGWFGERRGRDRQTDSRARPGRERLWAVGALGAGHCLNPSMCWCCGAVNPDRNLRETDKNLNMPSTPLPLRVSLMMETEPSRSPFAARCLGAAFRACTPALSGAYGAQHLSFPI